jgi:DNA-3-methyladenine glycosylase II
MRRIDTEADIAEGLVFLLAADPRLRSVAQAAGAVPLRRSPGGFSGLAHIVTAQQISDAAADAIWARLQATLDPFTPEALLAAGEARLRAAGLSRPKIRALTAVAEAASAGFDLDGLVRLPPEEGVAALVRLKGVGPWTAEVYLLFCCGHADIFPAGDLALRAAARDALSLPERPGEAALREIARGWSPWRGVAARLFWAYYRAVREREGVRTR